MVAAVHAPNLGKGDMRLVHKQEEIVRKIVELCRIDISTLLNPAVRGVTAPMKAVANFPVTDIPSNVL